MESCTVSWVGRPNICVHMAQVSLAGLRYLFPELLGVLPDASVLRNCPRPKGAALSLRTTPCQRVANTRYKGCAPLASAEHVHKGPSQLQSSPWLG